MTVVRHTLPSVGSVTIEGISATQAEQLAYALFDYINWNDHPDIESILDLLHLALVKMAGGVA